MSCKKSHRKHKQTLRNMKFSIDKNVFISGLQQVINVVSLKAAIPVLSNVLIVADDEKLTLTTTNLDLTIRCSVKANVTEKGAITLPAKKLATIIRALPQQIILLDESNNKVKITSGNSIFDIAGLPAEDFPSIDGLDNNTSNVLILQQKEMSSMLKIVSYAQSNDDNRKILNGVYFCFYDGKTNFVATDGRRLSIVWRNMEESSITHPGVIVPSKTINEVERLLGHGDDVNIVFNDRQISFKIDINNKDEKCGLIDNIFVVSKVVDGNYPNFRQVMPKEAKNRVKIDRQLLLDSLQRVSLVTSELKNSIRMRFSLNNLEIYASSAEYGEARESIAIQYDGPVTEIAFNPTFLCDPLKVLTEDEVFFEFNNELSPGVFKTLGDFMCVVMPLRVS